MPPLAWYGIILGVAAAVTAAATTPARKLSARVGYVDLPQERKVHDKATPYGGGAAMLLGFLVAMIVAALVSPLHVVFANSSEPLGVVLAGSAIFAVGLIDDVRDMSAPAKIAGQVLAASILYFLGVTMYEIKVPFAGLIALTPGVTPLITAVWVIALTNAINLIDGLDGLAAGVVAIGGGALAVYGLRLMQLGVLPLDNIGPLIAVIACGVCLGFLPFNFHPARVFMGDAGALLLGLLMSASTMVIGGRIPVTSLPVRSVPVLSGVTYFFFAPLIIPLFILGVPILDMAFAFLRRTARGSAFHTPDKEHIHYRLLRLGHGHRRSVLILWAWTAVLSGFVLFPLFIARVNAVIPLGAAALGVGLYTLFHPGLRRGEADERAGAATVGEPSQTNGLGLTNTATAPRSTGQPNGGPERTTDGLVLVHPTPRPEGSASAGVQRARRGTLPPDGNGLAGGHDQQA
jgi:UDP-GlcNAc:undecaprenyl-phosphate/decaprenyl-phosphate GlcNAc-1-phosphate transferase